MGVDRQVPVFGDLGVEPGDGQVVLIVHHQCGAAAFVATRERHDLDKALSIADLIINRTARAQRWRVAEHFDAASRDQKYRFLDVFKSSLINTYASGLTLYDGQDIRVLPLQEEDVRGDRARVRMEVNTNSGKVIPIFYSLFRSEDGWKVENVIVNGLNLGKTFRSQFGQSMAEHGGNIDKVIANWSPDLNIDGADGGDPAEQAGNDAGADDAANGGG